MSRGTYAPLDHSRHFAIGYAVDQTVDYARDRTVGETARAVLPAYGQATRLAHGARGIVAGAEALGDRAGAESVTGLSIVSMLRTALFAGILIGGFLTVRVVLTELAD